MAKRPAGTSAAKRKTPAKKAEPAKEVSVQHVEPPLATLRQDMERLFDDFWSRFSVFPGVRRAFELEPFRRWESGLTMVQPAVDVVEGDKDFQITAEMPGLEKSDVELTVSGDVLTIKGEKREETETKEKDYRLSERRYGAFTRSFSLPSGTDTDKIEAKFEKGILHITLPKTKEAQEARKSIPISG